MGFVLLSALGASLAVPLRPSVDEDPELTAGYFEGDIVLEPNERNGLRSETRRWPNNLVYYKFSEGYFGKEWFNFYGW